MPERWLKLIFYVPLISEPNSNVVIFGFIGTFLFVFVVAADVLWYITVISTQQARDCGGEVLSDYALLMWPKPCQEPQCLRPSGDGKALPFSVCWQCFKPRFLLPVCTGRLVPGSALPLIEVQSPFSLQIYTINVLNFWAAHWYLSIRAHSSFDANLSVCACVLSGF